MSDRLDELVLPLREQYESSSTPDKYLARIIKTGFRIRNADVDLTAENPRDLPIEHKIMFWHQQASKIRKGQPARMQPLQLLYKQVEFHEQKRAQKDAQEAAIWAAFWQQHDMLAGHQLNVWRQHEQKKARAAATAAAAKRVADANSKESERRVHAHREHVQSLREAEVDVPLVFLYDAFGRGVRESRK